MVSVFMGDQDRTNLPGIKGRCVYSLECFFCAQTGINRSAPLSPSRKTQLPLLPLARIVQRIVLLLGVFVLECLTVHRYFLVIFEQNFL